MRSDSRSFNSSYPSPSSGRKRKSTPSNWSARGQCTRAPARIGDFFSLACAFIPHSFKSKEAPPVRDRDGALAWLAASELSLDKSLFGKSVLQVLWSEQSTEPALPEACGEWGRKTRQSLSLREKRNIAKTETPRLKSKRPDRRKVLFLRSASQAGELPSLISAIYASYRLSCWADIATMVKQIFVHRVGMKELTESSCLSPEDYERFKGPALLLGQTTGQG
ncbi:hypothetical protein V6N12_037242 [Hibiscus sabdariffa]|uniref:Uncharacterized protein n=1 Tax=Hibiscus sabdariffa TaxID=183260 RepID=A0ABR2C3A9_9ROSI